MRHWNFRVIRREVPVGPGYEALYGIYEAFYDDAGLIWSISEDPCSVQADSPEELEEELANMARAFKSPILDYDKLPETGAKDPSANEK